MDSIGLVKKAIGIPKHQKSSLDNNAILIKIMILPISFSKVSSRIYIQTQKLVILSSSRTVILSR